MVLLAVAAVGVSVIAVIVVVVVVVVVIVVIAVERSDLFSATFRRYNINQGVHVQPEQQEQQQ